MHIQVVGDQTIGQQARTYAEYRVFAVLTQRAGAERVQEARVVLRSAGGCGDGESVTCMVTVTMTGSNRRRVRTTGDHPYAAINRAVERLSVSTSEPVNPGCAESG